MAGLNTTAEITVSQYYDKRFLLRAKPSLVAYEHAQKRDLPTGEGKTVYYTRILPLPKNTTALTEAVDGGKSVATREQLKLEQISATLQPYGDFVTISKIAEKTTIDKGLKNAIDVVGVQGGESIDYLIMKELATHCTRQRADGDATYHVKGTADSGSTTTLVDAALTQADDAWNGGFITITAGTNYGITRQVTDFVASSDTLTFAAFPKAIDTTSKYTLTVGTNLGATDKLSDTALRLAVRTLKRNKAMRYDGNMWVGMLDPDTEYDFMGDTNWQNAAVYKDRVQSLYTGELGTWMGIRFVQPTSVYRESVAGVEADGSGLVHVIPIIGKESYGVVEMDGQKKTIVIRQPKELGQALDLYSSIGWQVMQAPKMLNSDFAVGIECGATA